MLYLNGLPIKTNHFPDGTSLIKKSVSRNFETKRPPVELTWIFENNEELVNLIFVTRHLQEHGVNEIRLYMPYIPNARQDRVKSDEDVFTLKYFSEIINGLNFTSVMVLDPHSPVSEALINRLVVKSPEKYIDEAVHRIYDIHGGVSAEPLMAFFPDEGAMKRYAGMVGMKYAFGIKKRNFATGKIEGLEIITPESSVEGKRIIIIDDICSRGGTFYHSAKKLKELGAKEIYLYVTHCENTVLEGELIKSGLIEKIYTTESIFTKENEKIEVLI